MARARSGGVVTHNNPYCLHPVDRAINMSGKVENGYLLSNEKQGHVTRAKGWALADCVLMVVQV
jgi:hypothetical protein